MEEPRKQNVRGSRRLRVELDDPEIDGGLSEQVIGCTIEVNKELGTGFLEKVYENALAVMLRESGIPFEQQKALKVNFHDTVVGEYAADIVVDGRIILELKAARSIDSAHEAQLLNYLRATGLRLGLILNFGKPRLQIRRLVY